jgi:predicted DNA-binding protein (MmcQ/YjbR family)
VYRLKQDRPQSIVGDWLSNSAPSPAKKTTRRTKTFEHPMSRAAKKINAQLREHALSYPEAWEDYPWGGVVAKVRKKIFCTLGHEPETSDQVCFGGKLPNSGTDALDLAGAEPTHYGMGEHGWVTFRLDPNDMPDIEVLKGYIDESFRAIAPKTLVKQLDAKE